ncbi:hypothetical protein [Rhodococcus sp. 24CO]|uniref:hypothetical protein n=1 Tax=Rhodococcus sp. 24CO TaxID=3117460 RepID=UPI003D345E0D
MSYDILAFEPSATSDEDFASWYENQVEWSEDHGYDDPSVTTSRLRAFYEDLVVGYRAMNGPGAPTDEELDADGDLESRLTDYSIGTTLVYAAFAWSQAEEAQRVFCELAAKHEVAVALVSESSTPAIIRPS